MRRRARFLHKARELAYRDLGGLVFELHRFGQRNDPVVLAKLSTLSQIHTELSALESALRERQSVTVLREVGIAACPRCAAIHGSDDRFCPGCGLAFDAKADRPISTSPVTQGPVAAPSGEQTPKTQSSVAAMPFPMPASPPAPASGAAPASPTSASTPAPGSTPASAFAPAPASPAAPSSHPAPRTDPLQRPGPPASSPTQTPRPPQASPPSQAPPQTPPPSQAPPVRAPSTPAPASKRDGADDDEPTQILRPPGQNA